MSGIEHDEGHPHLTGGEFQSDKYPTTPRGKVPLSCKDRDAQDLLWLYAQRRRAVDAEFAADLEIALRNCGYDHDAMVENVARRVYDIEPFYMPIGSMQDGMQLARKFNFEDAPAYRQNRAREIAKAALRSDSASELRGPSDVSGAVK
jgi:hypothetical protein